MKKYLVAREVMTILENSVVGRGQRGWELGSLMSGWMIRCKAVGCQGWGLRVGVL